MTIKLVALWTAPEDAAAFDADYEATHVGLVNTIPGMERAVFSKALNGPYHRMAELVFADMDQLGAALGSDEGAQVLADAGRLQEVFGNQLDVLTVEEQATS